MDTIPASVWFQLISVFLSTIVTVATFVWFLGKMKSQFDLQLNDISTEVKIVQNTVGPYGPELEKTRTRLLTLTDRVTKVEAGLEVNQRDIARVSDRQDKMQGV